MDYRLKGKDGITVSKKLLDVDHTIKIIIITGFPAFDTAVKSIKAGVFDFMSKGSSNEKIIKTINKAIHERDIELLAKDGHADDDTSLNFVLICNHTLIIERLKKFSGKSLESQLVQIFRSLEQIKNTKLDRKIDIALICPDCLTNIHKDSQRFFHELTKLLPSVKPVVISEDVSDEERVNLLKLGVKGFCEIDGIDDKLEKLLPLIKGGEVWASRKVTAHALHDLLKERPDISFRESNPYDLTAREKEILEIMVAGHKNRDIADKLNISEMTVKTHIYRIFKKLEVDSRAKATLKAMENNLFD